MTSTDSTTPAAADLVRDAVRSDIEQGTFGGRVKTRFPPEPNGYLHIGHAKAITVNFGIAAEFGGICNLRFDDTNPDTEDVEYVDGIIDDLAWLGFPVKGEPLYASDYFEQLLEWAEHLITAGFAYVDDQDGETISSQRGGYGRPGIESPFRDRAVDQNLDLFRRMRTGEFDEGTHVLRAKIDMQHENMQMRDPVMYRIRKLEHHRTGDTWKIYPTYDWAHGQSDAIEGVTHSLCTLEFDSHRPLYDWFLAHLPLPFEQPRQIEFARLELTFTVTSKRKLAQLVSDGTVDGWDDPRMPTLRGMRRRGYPAAAIRNFCGFIGVARTNSRHQIELFESFVRSHLNQRALRRMAVLNPVPLTITNWPTDEQGAADRRALRHRQQPGGRFRRHPPCCVQRTAVHRTRRLHGRPTEAVLPDGTGTRGSSARCLLRHVHRIRHRSRRQHHRGTCHVRPRHERRVSARWSQGEIDHALGIGRPCRRRHGRSVRPPVQRRGTRRSHRRPARRREPGIVASCSQRASSKPHSPTLLPAGSCSSSGWATSPRTPRLHCCSIAPSACATSGRKSRSGRNPQRLRPIKATATARSHRPEGGHHRRAPAGNGACRRAIGRCRWLCARHMWPLRDVGARGTARLELRPGTALRLRPV